MVNYLINTSYGYSAHINQTICVTTIKPRSIQIYQWGFRNFSSVIPGKTQTNLITQILLSSILASFKIIFFIFVVCCFLKDSAFLTKITINEMHLILSHCQERNPKSSIMSITLGSLVFYMQGKGRKGGKEGVQEQEQGILFVLFYGFSGHYFPSLYLLKSIHP